MPLRPGLPRTPSRAIPSRATVLGLGRTGLAVAEVLARQGSDVLASDARPTLPPEPRARLEAAGVHLCLGENPIRPGDTVIISPGIPPKSPLFRRAQAEGSELLSEPELFARLFKGCLLYTSDAADEL